MHEDDIIFSAIQGDNSMEGKDLQSRRLTARLNIPKRWFNYSTGLIFLFTADFQRKKSAPR